jgi:hypothetical protein
VTTIGDKAAHVRQAADPGGHTCHWPGCTRRVKPALWGCKEHWFKLPARLRAAIWRCYRPGQEDDKRPSREYVEVAREVEAWIDANHGDQAEGRLL